MSSGRPDPSSRVALFDGVGDRFFTYYASAQGQIRREVVQRNLAEHLPTAATLDVLDLGCGEGYDAAWLASLGHRVTGLDPSERMLAAARKRAETLDRDCRLRLRLLQGDSYSALALLNGFDFDLVTCHGVLMYEDDASGFLRSLTQWLRPGGMLSLVTKNAAGLAYRSVSEGDISEAHRLLRDTRSLGRLGVQTAAHHLHQIEEMLEDLDLVVENWFGIKVFSDSFTDVPRDNFPALLALEIDASRQDPYRHTARLIQVLAQKV